MISTREAIRLLALANPDDQVDEERVRRALRTGRARTPLTVAGRFVWNDSDLKALALALGLHLPGPEKGGPAG